MDKITKYRIARDTDITRLEKKVNALLEEGWELYGDFRFVKYIAANYVQPLVLRQKENECHRNNS